MAAEHEAACRKKLLCLQLRSREPLRGTEVLVRATFVLPMSPVQRIVVCKSRCSVCAGDHIESARGLLQTGSLPRPRPSARYERIATWLRGSVNIVQVPVPARRVCAITLACSLQAGSASEGPASARYLL